MTTTMLTKSASFARQGQDAVAKARAIAETAAAAGREMTEAEATEFKSHMQAARDFNAQKDAAKADEAMLVELKTLGDALGLPTGDVDAQMAAMPHRDEPAAKSLGETIATSTAYKALVRAWTKDDGEVRIPDRVAINSDPIGFKSLIGQKALFVGGTATSAGAFVTPDRTDIVEMLGRRTLTIRDLISVRRTTSDSVEYVVQTSHTNNAAIVPEATSSAAPTAPGTAGALVLDPNGGYKPEGAWAFAEMSTTVKTIAEWVPATKRALADVAQLEGLINDELVLDLKEAEESQILNGSGTGNNITGILATSGIQSHAKGADTLPDAFRKALTKVRSVGRTAPTGILLNPVDMEKVDLLKDTTGQYLAGGPWAGFVRTLWGVPLVESEAQPVGTGLIADFTKAILWDREDATVTMTNSHADFFIRNLVAILAEERVAFGVTRPAAFCTVTGL